MYINLFTKSANLEHVYIKIDVWQENNQRHSPKCTMVGQLQHLFEIITSKLKLVIAQYTHSIV
jgi:hypothetical protein